MSTDMEGITENYSYHTEEDSGNLGLAWYSKDSFRTILTSIADRTNSSIKKGYKLPVLKEGEKIASCNK